MNYKTLYTLLVILILILSGCNSAEPPGSNTTKLIVGNSAPSFSLQSNQGTVSLSDYLGKGVVLFFGYTNCPDICPTGLSTLTQAMIQLSNASQQQLQPIFITLDPATDTPSRLAEYLQYFHPQLIGLSGSQQALKQVAQHYQVQYKRQPQPNSEYDIIQHSAYYYFISPNGKLNQYLPHQSSVEQLKQALTLLNKEKESV